MLSLHFLNLRPLALTLFTFSLLCAHASAQGGKVKGTTTPDAPSVAVSLTQKGMRFVALGPVKKVRLEVLTADGSPAFDSGFRPGSVYDWRASGSALPDGAYQFVVTVMDVSGRLSLKQCPVVISGGDAALQLGEAEPAGVAAADASAAAAEAGTGAMALTAHDGRDGQVVSTSGALSFRLGDFFSGEDREAMRLTEAGLTVSGVVQAGGGIRFGDGSVLTSAGRAARVGSDGAITPSAVSGTGTAGRLTKWLDAAGTLGDSVVTESGGNIGVGTATPNNKLHVIGSVEIGAASGAGVNPTLRNPNTIANFAQFQFYPASGANTNMSFAVVPRGTGVSLNRAQLSVLNTDSIADSANVEFASLRARGADFVFSTGSTGTGVSRPIMFAAGFLRDNTTNDGQLFLDTNGRVGIGTKTPQSKLHVTGNVNFTGLRTEDNATRPPNVIGGYSGNSVTAGVVAATIGGGGGLSGFNNRVTDDGGTVGGGNSNRAGDGAGTTSDKTFATVGGGSSNVASGAGSAVGGGSTSLASGAYATIPGGFFNTAAGDYSLAAGRNAKADHAGAFVWADSTESDFHSTAPKQFLIRAGGGVGINTADTSAANFNVAGSGRFTGDLTVGGVLNGGGASVLRVAGTNNVFGGAGAGNANTTGGSNSFFGKDAGLKNTGGGSNTFVGKSAGLSNTTESGNTFVGASSNGAAGVTNATALGANATVSQSNTVVLGSNADAAVTTQGRGIILRATNGANCFRVTVDNAGALSTAAVTCP